MGLEPQSAIDIGGNIFTVKRLPLVESRKVYTKLQRILQMVFTDPALLEDGASAIQLAGLADGLSEETLEYLIKAFAKVTTVQPTDGGPDVTLMAPAAQQRFFADEGNFEDQFTWLDFAIRSEYGSAIAKMRDALKKAEARVQAEVEKAEARNPSLKGLTGRSGES